MSTTPFRPTPAARTGSFYRQRSTKPPKQSRPTAHESRERVADLLYGASASDHSDDVENSEPERHNNMYTPPLNGSSLYNSHLNRGSYSHSMEPLGVAQAQCNLSTTTLPSDTVQQQKEQQEVIKLLQQQQNMLAKVISQQHSLTETQKQFEQRFIELEEKISSRDRSDVSSSNSSPGAQRYKRKVSSDLTVSKLSFPLYL